MRFSDSKSFIVPENNKKMIDAVASTSRTLVSTHEKNIAMLWDKLKEFRMGADTTTHADVYNKVESECLFLIEW